MVGTNNLDKAINFYDTLLNTIELQRVVTNEKYAGYASKNKPDEVEFYVTNPVNSKQATFGNGTQISFLVKFGFFLTTNNLTNSPESEDSFPMAATSRTSPISATTPSISFG